MNDGRKIGRKFLVPGLALLAMLILGSQAPLSADRGAKATRSSGGKAPTMSRTSSSPPPSSSRATASGPSRSSAVRKATPRAVNTRRSTPASRGRHHRRSSYRPYRHHLGVSFGYGGYWGWRGYYGYYPYSFYPFYWGVPYYVPRRAYRQHELGAFDLNVRPKRTEVYLDGQYIGTAGQFDGFPDHLWLEQGSYELIFYRPGRATERRVLSVYPGVVVDVRLQLQPGESVPPEELTRAQQPEGAMAEVSSAYREQESAAPGTAPEARAELDTRAAPGRVRLSVLPADASVYLDGRLLGSGDELARLHAGLVVEAGSHLIEVVRPGYATERREFAVEAGGDVELKVLLEAG